MSSLAEKNECELRRQGVVILHPSYHMSMPHWWGPPHSLRNAALTFTIFSSLDDILMATFIIPMNVPFKYYSKVCNWKVSSPCSFSWASLRG